MEIKKDRLIELLNELIEYVDMVKDNDDNWDELFSFTDDELVYFSLI